MCNYNWNCTASAEFDNVLNWSVIKWCYRALMNCLQFFFNLVIYAHVRRYIYYRLYYTIISDLLIVALLHVQFLIKYFNNSLKFLVSTININYMTVDICSINYRKNFFIKLFNAYLLIVFSAWSRIILLKLISWAS